MSTHCQIDFVGRWKDRKGNVHVERRRIYRHSDGSPDKVIEDIKQFLEWLKPRPFEDVDYTAANFIYWCKRKRERENGEEMAKLGYGVCDNRKFSNFISYFYEVIGSAETDYIEVCVYKVKASPNKPVTRSNMKLIRFLTLQ